jgi:hypothetical protein
MTDPNRLDGIGVQQGPLRPDWGDGWADLACDRCDATWTGIIGEACDWCQRAVERMNTEQAQRALRPPDIDPADGRYTVAMEAWGKRLRGLVAVGAINERAARASWERHAGGAAA